MNRLQLARQGGRLSERLSLEEYAGLVSSFAFGGNAYTVTQTYGGGNIRGEKAEGSFDARVNSAYKTSGVVFACSVARLLLFSEARFQFRQRRGGRSGELFGTEALSILENPWPNGSTGELLGRMIQDVDLAGNAYIRRTGPTATPRLERLRPDWVTIILGTNSELYTPDVAGYMYEPRGPGQGGEVFMAREEVAHWSPIPDPSATYRGMSWMTPVLRDIGADLGAIDHKKKFFDNAATPNMIVKFDAQVAVETLERFKSLFNEEHQGFANAYKTLFLGGGADATVVGTNFQQMDFKSVQGHGETRIAAAAGIPPIYVGLSEGLEAATYSNYAQARRRFADGTIRPLWRSACSALSTVVPVPERAELWYDDRDIPALQEDEKDAAEIQAMRVSSMATLIREGFTPDSVQQYIETDDVRVLEHTGLVSVQLQEPGAQEPEPTTAPSVNGNTPQEVSP